MMILENINLALLLKVINEITMRKAILQYSYSIQLSTIVDWKQKSNYLEFTLPSRANTQSVNNKRIDDLNRMKKLGPNQKVLDKPSLKTS